MRISQQKFGETKDGKEVHLFTFENLEGVKVSITNYGGIITSILMPDQFGVYDNIVLGFKSFEDYVSESYLSSCPYFGAICGRFAGRIKDGRFSINGDNYQLVQNDGPNHLHGGLHGFDKKLWDFEIFEEPQKAGVKLSYLSQDGEENFPGNLKVTVIYSLNTNNELHISYSATSDKATPVNLTNHTYFNLSGGKAKVLDHELQLESEFYSEIDEMTIPVGTCKSVAGTPLDFRRAEPIRKGITELAVGYDHNFIINGEVGAMRKAAILSERKSGRQVEVFTTQPGLEVYSGYYLPELNGKYGRYGGIALETQHFPDSPNHPGFPDTILKPGEVFNEHTLFKFKIRI
jgi:aldose 1-epimerase